MPCRYKAEYQPSDLLCRKSLAWVPCTPKLLRALDERDGCACLSDLEQPHAEAPPAIPPAALPGGPYNAIPGLPTQTLGRLFTSDDILVSAQGSLGRMRHWLAGVASERGATHLRRLAAEVLDHVGPRAASQLCIVLD